jgi:hypothetical protein
LEHPYFDDFKDWFDEEIQTLIEFDSMEQHPNKTSLNAAKESFLSGNQGNINKHPLVAAAEEAQRQGTQQVVEEETTNVMNNDSFNGGQNLVDDDDELMQTEPVADTKPRGAKQQL